MIYFLSGIVKFKDTSHLILDVNGVGYGLELTLTHVSILPNVGETHSLWVYTKVREDSLTLYGFSTREERQTFELLVNINGVGPKVALAILSVLNIQQLKDLILENNFVPLQKVPGIGKKTAEKILLELKSKLDKLPCSPISVGSQAHGSTYKNENDLFSKQEKSEELLKRNSLKDLKSALNNLGFKDKDLSSITQKLEQEYKGESFPDLLRKALKIIGKTETNKQVSKSELVVEKKQIDLDEVF